MKLTCNYCNGEIDPSTKPKTDTDGSPLHRTAFECAESLKVRLATSDRRIDLMRPVIEAARTWKVKEKWPYLNAGELARALDAYEAGDEKSRKEPWTQEQKEALSKVADTVMGTVTSRPVSECSPGHCVCGGCVM